MNIKVSPDELRNASAVFTQKKEASQAIVTELEQKIAEIQNFWEGSAEASFLQHYEQSKINHQNFINTLEDIAKDLLSIADSFEQLDNSMKFA